ncbi:MAG: hypothetical protein ACI9TY_001055 [Alphaproteobacteria bacterium]|jgi:hypothetical protein
MSDSLNLITDLKFFETTTKQDLEDLKATLKDFDDGLKQYEKDLNALIRYGQENGFVECDVYKLNAITFEDYNDLRAFRLHLSLSVIYSAVQHNQAQTPGFIYFMTKFIFSSLETDLEKWEKEKKFTEENFKTPQTFNF